MGLGPITALYHARFNRYLQNRQIDDTSQSRVWCFLGDGECDEPETLGAISLAAREQLDNLIFVVNCNLQRLDGPVRGNGKIIQELEAIVPRRRLERDQGHLGLEVGRAARPGQGRRAAQPDEHHRRRPVPALLASSAASTSATTSSGPTRACARWCRTSPTTSCATCPAAATTTASCTPPTRRPPRTSAAARPTVILGKTIKGWTLGEGFEGRNATHQIKKMTKDQLVALRDRLYLHDEIPEDSIDADDPPYYQPAEGLDRVPVHDGAAQGARRVDPQAHHEGPPPAGAARRQAVRRAARRLGRPGGVDDDGLHPPAAQPVPATSTSARASCRSSPTRPARSAWTPCSAS